MRTLAAAAFITLACSMPLQAQAQPHRVTPPNGFVPDSITAIRIAVAIWTPIYGAAQIERQQPYHAALRDSVWTVVGSVPRGRAGGAALAEIHRRDGRVLRVSHGR
jgi:hypothetical protein